MADVEYEDYEIIKFPKFYEIMSKNPGPMYAPLKQPTFTFRDISGGPLYFHGGSYVEAPWIHTTRLSKQDRDQFSSLARKQLGYYNEVKGTSFEFVKLVKMQSTVVYGMNHYFQFEAKPSGVTDHTLKTFEGAVYEQFFPTEASWPVTCRLVGPNTQRFVPPTVDEYTVGPSTMSTPLPF